MRSFQLFPIFVLIPFLLSACKDRERTVANDTAEDNSTTATPPPQSDPAPTENSEQDVPLVFSLDRGACFGTCPFYRIHVYENGHATYEGLGHVEKMGRHEAHVDREIIEKLRHAAEEAGFFEMDEEYDGPVTDLASTTISVRRNGETKRVKGRVGQPAAFKRLATRADELLLPLDWKPVADH